MTPEPPWPALEDQIDQSVRGSALERLIREHQDFGLLRPEEATDRIGVPPWLRVYWRKEHPELDYRADDPTGGYPRLLRNLHAWMVTHPELQPEPVGPRAAAATATAAPRPSPHRSRRRSTDLGCSDHSLQRVGHRDQPRRHKQDHLGRECDRRLTAGAVLLR